MKLNYKPQMHFAEWVREARSKVIHYVTQLIWHSENGRTIEIKIRLVIASGVGIYYKEEKGNFEGIFFGQWTFWVHIYIQVYMSKLIELDTKKGEVYFM